MRVAVMALLPSQVPPAPTDVGGTSGSLSVPADTQLRAGGSRGRPKNKQMQQISCSWSGILAGYFRGQAACVPSMCARLASAHFGRVVGANCSMVITSGLVILHFRMCRVVQMAAIEYLYVH
jgi:hypothetical protein